MKRDRLLQGEPESGLNLIEIMKSAGWSNARTFAAYYEKPILTESFGTKLLEQFHVTET